MVYNRFTNTRNSLLFSENDRKPIGNGWRVW